MLDKIKLLTAETGAELKEDKGLYTLHILVAERKAFLSRKTLEYIARFRIDDRAKEIKFTEMLKESGSGLSMGDMDGPTPGFGFKRSVYKVGIGPREGTIEEESNLFGKIYKYTFDFKTIRGRFEKIAESSGYNFKYQITPIGL